ncbi:hypothetical protein [Ancylobacter rudongensis]|uniref:Uncharacterized protein n=1 Tax=Ancylobacter rudongensis TaxID=177413 RepID=A0A1G4PP81_9HYPH|nr:hypothetical protein [Ancylobacter rudongensis]SCW34090.1 hypothetical protein SAMN05660859_0687 [Ancylobacter rudongensis]
MRDIISNIAVVEAVPPAAYGADNTPSAIDIKGFDAAMLAIHVGIGGISFNGTNKIEFKLTHSDDDATYTAVTIDDVQGLASVGAGGIVKALVAAHAAPSITRVGYVGNKRFLKLLADFSGTHGTATPLSATVIKGHARERPVA